MTFHLPNFLPQNIEGVFYEVLPGCDYVRTFNVIDIGR